MLRRYCVLYAAAACLVGIGFSPRIASAQAILAEAYIASGDVAREHSDLPKAARMYALALVESHGQQHALLTAHALLGAAAVHIELDELTQAEENVRAALELCDGLATPPKDLLHMGLNCMAMIAFHQDEFEKSEACYAKLLKDIDHTEESHVILGILLNDMALVQIALKQPEEAAHFASAAADIMLAEFGDKSAHYAQCLDTLAQAYHGQGRLEEAEHLSLASLEICAEDIGHESPQFGSALMTLGKIQHGKGHHAESAQNTERGIALQEEHRGADHPLVKQAKEDHAALHHSGHAAKKPDAEHHEPESKEHAQHAHSDAAHDHAFFDSLVVGQKLSAEELHAAREHWNKMSPEERRAAIQFLHKLSPKHHE